MAGLVLGAAFLPLALALATWLAFVAIFFVMQRGADAIPYQQLMAPFYVAIALAFVVDAIFNPRPLPKATISTTDKFRVVGDHIVTVDGAWYIGDGRGNVLVVPADHVNCTRLVSRPRRYAPFWRTALNEKEPRPATPPPLDCAKL